MSENENNNNEETDSDRNVTIEFLESYKNLRCLWDKTCPEYSNRHLKKMCFEKLLSILRKINKPATLDTLKSKLEKKILLNNRSSHVYQINEAGVIHSHKLF